MSVENKTIYNIIGITFIIVIVLGCQSAETVSPIPATLTPLSTTVTSIPPTATQTHAPAVTLIPTVPATLLFTETPPPEPAVSSDTLFPLEKSPQEFDSRGTYQIGLGDLDGDGDLDGVFANPLKHSSEVWLNDGNGTFVDTGQKLTQYGHGVGIADFDEDGDLDAFIACHQFITPSKIYLNDGSGNFQDTGQDLGDRGMSGSELNLLDLNGDGHIDVHILYYDPNRLPDKVYLNDGAANFTDSGLALDEDTIAWGDLDGDGDVDYFGKLWGRGYVVQFNDGSGNFSEGWQFESAQTTNGGIALADFDGDGDLDALVANGFRETGGFPSLLFWNDGSGLFTESDQRLNETMGAEVGVGDLDGDGDLDVFIANMDLPNEVWLNNGDGYFADSGLRLGEIPPQGYSTVPSLGDLDGDGDLDIFVGSLMGKPEIWFNNSPAVTTYLKVPPVSFEPSPQSFDPAFTFQIGLGDLDGDHDLDAVFSNMRFSYSQVWFNDGTGYFVDSGQEFTQQGHGVALGDVDQDGDLDIFIAVATYEENNVSSSMPSKIYLNDGGGKFHDSGQDLGDKKLNGTGVDLFDIDGDQDLDALVIHYGTPNKIYLNDGRGLFSDSGRTFPDETTWGDLDSDGDVDLFVKELGRGYKTMLNDSAGNFVDYWRMDDENVIYGRVVLGDLDGDGDQDAIVTNGDQSGSFPTKVLINDGTGSFFDSEQSLTPTYWASIGLGDLNGDNHLDGLVVNFLRPDDVWLWLNDSSGNFIDYPLDIPSPSGSIDCSLGDLDGDGDLDVFLGDFDGGSNKVWFNTGFHE